MESRFSSKSLTSLSPRFTTLLAAPPLLHAANNCHSVGILLLPSEPQIAVKNQRNVLASLALLSIAITSRSRRCRVGLSSNFSNPSLLGSARIVLVKESSTTSSKTARLFRILE
ncbi:hypothetical protein SO802_003791 [Lithocarpus litseifolius]|uniref:Uncharacterized protein n=1 Tax=Lithocarpus litseifolius TaxID=425828 RepID=A0AAW2E1N2_9ROSI